ncbi:MAG: hypothetical protein M3R26_04100, partial [Actinomycetota bacterium]|nr:hypothetical protein [Actinomycetota bacterium]
PPVPPARRRARRAVIRGDPSSRRASRRDGNPEHGTELRASLRKRGCDGPAAHATCLRDLVVRKIGEVPKEDEEATAGGQPLDRCGEGRIELWFRHVRI